MISDADLEELETSVCAALDREGQDDLPVLGYGVTCVVLGYPFDQPNVVCKRLPPFATEEAYERHRELILDYVAQLRQAGVAVVDTEVVALPAVGERSGVVGYVVQPLLPEDTLGPAILRAADPAEGHPLIRAVVDAVAGVTTDRRGIDAQITNWAWLDGSHRFIDVTTPFLLDEDGEVAMDLDVFLASAPAVTLPFYRREIPKAIKRYCDPRVTLVDLVGLLYKDDLDDWVPVILEDANRVADPPITIEEVRKYYDGEAKQWTLVNRLQRVDRSWQRRIRRRRYDFFIPPMEYSTKAWRAKKRTF